jgi:hypothetical protein
MRVWLEALRQLCNYSFGDIESVSADEGLLDMMQDLCDHNATLTMVMHPGENPHT